MQIGLLGELEVRDEHGRDIPVAGLALEHTAEFPADASLVDLVTRMGPPAVPAAPHTLFRSGRS